ncbi:type II secretion system protein GspK [Erwinia tracheiphila]|uniref:General secretion pathway protein GspK n=1 Tax=Erwinia tracheiphila TaxID=65700 RepID=A0A0M2KGW9_9GAMM|nr:type II secretion system protein GspK [Erwinia tracheiphila]EOS93520.1 general secretion pathway protein K [Erwinia tracheiphila PSU-1]KKF36582.1 general secretion pathway protein GspK [Erwinia tracheiphila]UIA87915.1 type II secretion system protein GspK [Erwinia tracheiphila]UIA96510.1 type II secretion system protein GspK [Erwinia tracheiphila]
MRPSAPAGERGMILLMVLLVISLIMVMIASLSRTGQTTRQSVSSAQQRLQAKWQLLGAEAAVAAELQLQLDGNGGILPDAASWLRSRSVRVSGGDVRYVLRDLGACFNLNWLLASVKKGQEGNQDILMPDAWFQQLLVRIGAGQSLSVQRLRDMLQGYLFRDDSQLLAVAVIPPAPWQRLLGQICVVSGLAENPKLNVNGLTSDQLPLLQAALKKPVDDGRLRQLLASRPDKGWKDQKEIPVALLDGLPITALFRYSSNDYQLSLESAAPGGNWILRTYLHYEKQKMHVVYRQFDDNTE